MKLYREFLKEVELSVINAGITVPAQRRAFTTHSFRGHDNELQIWDWIWRNTDQPGVKTQAIFYAETLEAKALSKDVAQMILKWQDGVSNWWHCDGLSKVFTRFLEKDTKRILPVLKGWNFHEDPWKRRQSVVSLLYYSRTKKSFLPFETILPFISALLEDDEYYVQKGLGWAMRELYSVYPVETLIFMNENYHRITGIAFSAASEKLSIADKEALKLLRKNQRKIFA